MKENAMVDLDRERRRRFWARLCRMGIVRERELVRAHQVAQVRRMSPEAALVALGILTAEQAVAILTEEAPLGLSMDNLGVS
jgi:hypothetical protein